MMNMEHIVTTEAVVLGGLVISVLATGSNIHGFKPVCVTVRRGVEKPGTTAVRDLV
jgi:hypothetical protein